MAMGLSKKSHGIATVRPQSVRRVVSGILLLAGATSVVAQVQQTPPPAVQETAGLAEVVVTPARRAENIQSVPIAVAAFAAVALQSPNLSNVQTLGSLSPGVSLDAGAPFS